MKREQGGWCNLFRDNNSKEKEQGIIVTLKNTGSNFIMGKKKQFLICQLFWIPSLRNGALNFSLALVDLILSQLVWAKMCMVYVDPPKWSINQFKPVEQSKELTILIYVLWPAGKPLQDGNFTENFWPLLELFYHQGICSPFSFLMKFSDGQNFVLFW